MSGLGTLSSAAFDFEQFDAVKSYFFCVIIEPVYNSIFPLAVVPF